MSLIEGERVGVERTDGGAVESRAFRKRKLQFKETGVS